MRVRGRANKRMHPTALGAALLRLVVRTVGSAREAVAAQPRAAGDARAVR